MRILLNSSLEYLVATAPLPPLRSKPDAPPAVELAGSRRQLPPPARYARLMETAAHMFQDDQLSRLAPKLRGGPTLAEMNGQGIHGLDPIAATEAIAYDFLAKGGKHSRPFITLAVYDALTSEVAAEPCDGDTEPFAFPDSVLRCALSIETFHKASLVHDDIEDDDEFRYGAPTLHRKYGTATAINVGDYLIGLGYRLVSRETSTLGADVVADILDRLADAHLQLSEGQGAELIWRDSPGKQLTPRDAINIYALKTAPAFAAALHTGLRLAGPVDHYGDSLQQFARHLGVAFQIINDLNDWHGDSHNKLCAAGDVIGGRPTLLWALALEGLNDLERAKLQSLAARQPLTADDVRAIRTLYETAGVFETAAKLVEKYQARAEAIAANIEPVALRQLFGYLIDLVLRRRR